MNSLGQRTLNTSEVRLDYLGFFKINFMAAQIDLVSLFDSYIYYVKEIDHRGERRKEKLSFQFPVCLCYFGFFVVVGQPSPSPRKEKVLEQ